MRKNQLVLASASPRRRELLEQLGVVHEVKPVHLDETRQAGEPPRAYVQRLALEKARAGAARVEPAGMPVLGADTVVVVDGEVLGKPADRAAALAMLARLSDRTHTVFSAVALVAGARCRQVLSETRVGFRAIAPAEAAAYWETGEPADKAGGYAIQGLGAVFVARIEGSYSGVMGLPLFETARLLEEAGIRILRGRP